MPTLEDLAAFLDRYLAVHRFEDDQGGIYHAPAGDGDAPPRLVQRLGLALEPWPGLSAWAEKRRLDALFLHRPWRLPGGAFAPTIGVLAYHLAFDERLTLGYNPRLADALGLIALEVLGEKQGRPLGMIGDLAPPAPGFAAFRATADDIFGGEDEARPYAGGKEHIERVAVVGAMNDALVREAHARGAQIYITGQWRVSAETAVRDTGLGVLVVGHRRSEDWGLRALAGVLRERWANLEVVLPGNR